MKLCKVYLLPLLAVFLCLEAFSQAPQKFNYQAVVRNSLGSPITNQDVAMRFTLHGGSPAGPTLYIERDTTHANSIGVIAVVVGGGGNAIGSLDSVDWTTAGGVYMQVEMDPTGGSAFTDMGTTQMLSVPIAMYAVKAGNSTPGPQGPVGPAGPQGTAGTNGVPGAPGPQGPQGVQGSIGATGPQGNDGIQGPAGLQGAVGPAGNDGAVGPVGPQGLPGNDGAVGPQGPQGRAGVDGATGPIGARGLSGNDGAVGPAGPQGPAGVDGAIGAIGPQGPAGNDGAVGPAGPQGPAGVDGAIGAIGPQGPAGNDGVIGAVGPQGPAGIQGPQGLMGLQGPAGNDGAVGPQGLQGVQGVAGVAGTTGPQGPQGIKGATGPVDSTWAKTSGGNVNLSSGNVGINNPNPTAALDVNGFSRLGAAPSSGATAPAIQVAKFTGYTPSNNSSQTSIALPGVSDSKVLNVNVTIHTTGTKGVIGAVHSNIVSDQLYTYYIYNSTLYLNSPNSGNSNGTLSQPVSVMVTYEQ